MKMDTGTGFAQAGPCVRDHMVCRKGGVGRGWGEGEWEGEKVGGGGRGRDQVLRMGGVLTGEEGDRTCWAIWSRQGPREFNSGITENKRVVLVCYC